MLDELHFGRSPDILVGRYFREKSPESIFEDVYAEMPWPLRQEQEELKKSRIVLTDGQ